MPVQCNVARSIPLIATSDIVLILLAAGRGERLGGAKLALDLLGKPLGIWSAETYSKLQFKARIAVVSQSAPTLSHLGYEELQLAPPDAPLSSSIRTGMQRALFYKPKAIMFALADMPFVTAEHAKILINCFDGDLICSQSRGGARLPPAIYGAKHFEALGKLSDDRGGGSLLTSALAVTLPWPGELDIDTKLDVEIALASLREADPLPAPNPDLTA